MPRFCNDPAHLYLYSKRPKKTSRTPRGKHGGRSLIIHLFAKQIKRCTAQSNISQRSSPLLEPIPEGKAAAGAAGAASTGGGDGGGLFIPSATTGNIHTAEIPQRKRNLVQTLPSAGIVEPCGMGSCLPHLEAHVFQYTAHLFRHKVIHSVNMKHIQGCANVNSGRLFLQAWMKNLFMVIIGEKL